MLNVEVHIDPRVAAAALADDVRRGLCAEQKWLPPLWLYDERGSDLFEQITRLPAYYPTRAERSILERHAAEIAALAQCDVLVELGSGTSEKTRLLLDAMSRRRLERFVPFDISEATLRGAAAAIASQYQVEVAAIVGDFNHHLDRIPPEGRRLVAFLGGTVGNLSPERRRRFLLDLDATLGSQDRVLLGTDLVKAPERLVAAYDDDAGVTAAFNKNVLARLNRELGATFDLDDFEHVAVWNDHDRWIEMRLRARRAHAVRIAELELTVAFERGEEILTETSAKFTEEQVRRELEEGGFAVVRTWTDPGVDFLLTLAHPYC